ncbi:alanine racemase [bacterium]|nr:alanine racemase [bacterium]
MQHHTRVFVDLRAYETNLKILSSTLSPPTRFCAVVKADAYGHGLERVAPIAAKAEVDYLAITENWEAECVRDLGISTPLLRLRPATNDEIITAFEWGVEEIVGSLEGAQRLSAIAVDRRMTLRVHVALDVGISRMSFPVKNQWEAMHTAMRLPGLAVAGIMTHFPSADEKNCQETRSQQRNFLAAVQKMQPPTAVILHAANSAGGLRLADTHLDMVRFGIISYGLAPSEFVPLPNGMQPVMSWNTRVVEIREVPKGSTIGYGMTKRLTRDSRVATLPIGYADAYLRAFSNKADVLIRGKRCPVVGRVSMNMVTVDVTDHPSAMIGDEVVLMGTQGEEQIAAEELAGFADTINYEITCLLGRCNAKGY